MTDGLTPRDLRLLIERVFVPGPADRGLAPRLRDDEVSSDPLAFGPFELAPEWRDGFFVVPRLPALDSSRPDAGDEPT